MLDYFVLTLPVFKIRSFRLHVTCHVKLDHSHNLEIDCISCIAHSQIFMKNLKNNSLLLH